jgi:hypothetical protein
MKRTGRKHRHLQQHPQPGTPADAASPPGPRMSSVRRFDIEMAICLIVSIIVLYFLNRANDAAQRDCEARGGKFVVNRTSQRCVLPGEPAAP